ncbi:MAG: replicative DNA helicase, partial [Gammaproteobacteria bacterium]
MPQAATTQTVSTRTEALRLPPHSVEAEQAVLGGLMLDNSAWDKIADVLNESDFYRQDHRLMFSAIGTLVEHNAPCDVVTISEQLQRDDQLENSGGMAYLASLAKNTPSAANVRAYAEIVHETSMLRQLIEAGNEIASNALNPEGRQPAEILDLAESAVFKIAEKGDRGAGFVPLKKILPATIDRLDFLHRSEGDVTGVPTGFNELDRKTAGLQSGDLIIVAGRPSMGKTSLALNIAENAAFGHQVPTAIFSMEMSAEQLAFRMISSLGRVNQSHLRTGN